MGTDSLYYIRDYSGNYYRINNVNELVAVRNETDATVFNYDQARSHIGTGKKNDISEQSEDVVSQVMAGRSDEKQMEKICFHWGTMNIIGFLTAYQETYSMFSPDGKPVRAEVSLTINGKDDGYEKVTSSKIKEPEKKVETPFDKAMKTYNNPARWKEFASQDTDMRKILG